MHLQRFDLQDSLAVVDPARTTPRALKPFAPAEIDVSVVADVIAGGGTVFSTDGAVSRRT